MKFEHNNIEDFFRDAFSNYEEIGMEHFWFDIDAKVTRNNFYKFSFTNFNVVYLVLIITTFIFTSYLTINSYISKKDIIDQKDTPYNIQYIYDTITETKVIYNSVNKYKESIYDTVVPVTSSGKQIEQKNFIFDSSIVNDESTRKNNQIIVDTIQKIIFIKPPAVVIKDTITMEAPKNRKNGKKH